MDNKSTLRVKKMHHLMEWVHEFLVLPLKNYMVAGVLVAFLSAYMRVSRDGSESGCLRRVQEAAVCGSLTLTITMGIQAVIIYFEVDPEKAGALIYCLSIFTAGFVGNLGSNFVRQLARKLVTKRVDEASR